MRIRQALSFLRKRSSEVHENSTNTVIPAKAGIQDVRLGLWFTQDTVSILPFECYCIMGNVSSSWIPAFAGMTVADRDDTSW